LRIYQGRHGLPDAVGSQISSGGPYTISGIEQIWHFFAPLVLAPSNAEAPPSAAPSPAAAAPSLPDSGGTSVGDSGPSSGAAQDTLTSRLPGSVARVAAASSWWMTSLRVLADAS
jgi:hypothetical protein